MSRPKTKLGRPVMAQENKRNKRITVPLNDDEFEKIDAVVKAAGIPAAIWCRKVLLRVAEASKK